MGDVGTSLHHLLFLEGRMNHLTSLGLLAAFYEKRAAEDQNPYRKVIFAQHAQNFRQEQEKALVAENEADAIYAHGMGMRA